MIQSQFIKLPYKIERAPPPFEGTEIRYPESLVRHFLKEYTSAGDTVFDPFAGQGTTLFVAESLKRVPYGMEADPVRCEWAAGQLEHWTNLRCGDAGQCARQNFPRMDFVITSPPFMMKAHRWNPLYAGDPLQAGYDRYLKRMRQIFKAMKPVIRRGARIVVQVDNLPGRIYTPLVRDMSLALEVTYKPEAEIIVAWEGGKPDYRHTHCLVFRNS